MAAAVVEKKDHRGAEKDSARDLQLKFRFGCARVASWVGFGQVNSGHHRRWFDLNLSWFLVTAISRRRV